MNIKEFVDKIEAYYGNNLPEFARAMTEGYLCEYETDNLGKLLAVLLKYHPINYGAPAIATIEKAHEHYYRGDARNSVEGHSSLKKRKASATKPVESEEPVATEAEVQEVLDGLEEGAANMLKGFFGKREV